MMTNRTKSIEELQREDRRHKAAQLAAEIAIAYGFKEPPVDPFRIAAQEHPALVLKGADFKSAFDGRLEYHPWKRRFLLFYNTKYDTVPGVHHPRTRFSVGHELGHFFIEAHKEALLQGHSHGSRSERFASDTVEAEADTFAANLLMPDFLFRSAVNKEPLSGNRLDTLAAAFQTSLISTAIRSVQISDFPCAVMAIRDGKTVWTFCSQPLIEGNCYPNSNAFPSLAKDRWKAFQKGDITRYNHSGLARDWFSIYGPATEFDLWLDAHFIPVRVMDTLLVLLTINETDLFKLEED